MENENETISNKRRHNNINNINENEKNKKIRKNSITSNYSESEGEYERTKGPVTRSMSESSKYSQNSNHSETQITQTTTKRLRRRSITSSTYSDTSDTDSIPETSTANNHRPVTRSMHDELLPGLSTSINNNGDNSNNNNNNNYSNNRRRTQSPSTTRPNYTESTVSSEKKSRSSLGVGSTLTDLKSLARTPRYSIDSKIPRYQSNRTNTASISKSTVTRLTDSTKEVTTPFATSSSSSSSSSSSTIKPPGTFSFFLSPTSSSSSPSSPSPHTTSSTSFTPSTTITPLSSSLLSSPQSTTTNSTTNSTRRIRVSNGNNNNSNNNNQTTQPNEISDRIFTTTQSQSPFRLLKSPITSKKSPSISKLQHSNIYKNELNKVNNVDEELYENNKVIIDSESNNNDVDVDIDNSKLVPSPPPHINPSSIIHSQPQIKQKSLFPFLMIIFLFLTYVSYVTISDPEFSSKFEIKWKNTKRRLVSYGTFGYISEWELGSSKDEIQMIESTEELLSQQLHNLEHWESYHHNTIEPTLHRLEEKLTNLESQSQNNYNYNDNDNNNNDNDNNNNNQQEQIQQLQVEEDSDLSQQVEIVNALHDLSIEFDRVVNEMGNTEEINEINNDVIGLGTKSCPDLNIDESLNEISNNISLDEIEDCYLEKLNNTINNLFLLQQQADEELNSLSKLTSLTSSSSSLLDSKLSNENENENSNHNENLNIEETMNNLQESFKNFDLELNLSDEKLDQLISDSTKLFQEVNNNLEKETPFDSENKNDLENNVEDENTPKQNDENNVEDENEINSPTKELYDNVVESIITFTDNNEINIHSSIEEVEVENLFDQNSSENNVALDVIQDNIDQIVDVIFQEENLETIIEEVLDEKVTSYQEITEEQEEKQEHEEEQQEVQEEQKQAQEEKYDVEKESNEEITLENLDNEIEENINLLSTTTLTSIETNDENLNNNNNNNDNNGDSNNDCGSEDKEEIKEELSSTNVNELIENINELIDIAKPLIENEQNKQEEIEIEVEEILNEQKVEEDLKIVEQIDDQYHEDNKDIENLIEINQNNQNINYFKENIDVDGYHDNHHYYSDFAAHRFGGRIYTNNLNDYIYTSPSYLSQATFFSKLLFHTGMDTRGSYPNDMITTRYPPHPGHCYAISGSTGNITVTFRTPIRIHQIGIYHLPVSETTIGIETTSIKEFSVIGWINKPSPNKNPFNEKSYYLGKFQYDVQKKKEPLQLFTIDSITVSSNKLNTQKNMNNNNNNMNNNNNSNNNKENDNIELQSFSAVTIIIHNNSGNEDYTCIYHIQVLGDVSNTM